jgi:hypothetical protein
LIWETGSELRTDKLTITLDNTVSKRSSWGCPHNQEECLLYSEKDNACDFCRHFQGSMKKTRIIKQKTMIIKKTDFDNLANAIESLNINELEKNNNLYYFGLIWSPPTIKVELYENEVNTFSYKYGYDYAPGHDFPTSLYPLNTIVQDIFKLAGIKSKRYCIDR